MGSLYSKSSGVGQAFLLSAVETAALGSTKSWRASGRGSGAKFKVMFQDLTDLNMNLVDLCADMSDNLDLYLTTGIWLSAPKDWWERALGMANSLQNYAYKLLEQLPNDEEIKSKARAFKNNMHSIKLLRFYILRDAV